MSEDRPTETPDDHWAWKLVFGVGWLVVIAATVYFTRRLHPRSWVSDADWLHVPALPGFLSWWFGPWKIVVLAVIVALVTWSHRATKVSDAQDTKGSGKDDGR